MKKIVKKFFKMRGVWLYSIVTILYVIWIYSVDSILQNMGVEYSQNVVGTIITTEKLANAVNVPAPDLIVLTVVPIFEEIVFRWLPLFTVTTVFSLLVSLLKRKNINTIIPNNIGIACTILVVLLSSAVFGYYHGNMYNLLLQGVLGLVLSMFYLRTYYRRKWAGKRVILQIFPLLTSTVYHILTNQIWYLFDWESRAERFWSFGFFII